MRTAANGPAHACLSDRENERLREISMRIRILAASAACLAITVACAPETAAPAAEAQAATAYRDKAPATAPDFKLVDHTGKTHQLKSMTDAKAIVVVMQGVGCPIVQKMTPDLKAVQAKYADKGVAFLMLNANFQDTPEMIANEAKNFDITMPILKDATQSVARSMGVERTAETFVIDPKGWKILYHGPLNDRLTYGRERAKAENDFVAQVLDGVLAGKPVDVVRQQADGCIINYGDRFGGEHAIEHLRDEVVLSLRPLASIGQLGARPAPSAHDNFRTASGQVSCPWYNFELSCSELSWPVLSPCGARRGCHGSPRCAVARWF
jgi:peroxiredoxin